MARTVTRSVTGLDSISAALKSIPVELRATILRDAVAKAAQPVKEAAKRFARRSVRTGALYASIDVKTVAVKGAENAHATAIIGPSRDYFRRGGRKVAQTGGSVDRRGAEQPARYAHLVEFGHAVKARGKPGSKPGKGKASDPKAGALRWVAPRPFMRPALAATSGRSQAILTAEIAAGIDRAAQKHAKSA